MVAFVIRRAFWAVWLFFVATFLTYAIFFLIPTDPVAHFNGNAAQMARIRHELHLDLPAYKQYGLFIWNFIRHGSLGYSFYDGASVRWIISEDAHVTLSLMIGGMVLWILIAIPIGVFSALRPRSLVDRGGMVFVLFGISAHPVWLGLILAYIFGYKLGWTPISDYCNFLPSSSGECSGIAHWAYHMILPWVTFMYLFAALYARLIRASVMEQQSEDYVRLAQAKGASSRRVVTHHILRNSLLPFVTMLGMDIPLAMGAALFVERVFNLHGLGYELVGASVSDDIPVVVGIVVIVCLGVIVCNFVVDVVYAWLDPRIRLEG